MIISVITKNEKFDQGCILKGCMHPNFKGLNVSIILNPTCLFENNKVDAIILAYLIPAKYVLAINKEWQDIKNNLSKEENEGNKEISKKKESRINRVIGKLIDCPEPRRMFYLNEINEIGIPASFIDYQMIASFPLKYVTQHSEIIAKANSPFREKIATHYSGYMMRIGVDRFRGTQRKIQINNLIQPIKLA